MDPRSWLSPEDRLRYYRRHEPAEQVSLDTGDEDTSGGAQNGAERSEETVRDVQTSDRLNADPEADREGLDREPLRRGEEEFLRRQAISEYRGAWANLPDFSPRDAEGYVRAHAGERPWLGSALDQGREVQRVFASIDSGRGHFLQRHEGFAADDQRLVDRLVYRHDPAQVDAVARTAMKDGTRPGEHYCADRATAIRDPLAFAAAFARGIEHPKVRALLDSRDEESPEPVEIPIEDLLGPDGHRDCVGYRLVPIEGSTRKAERYRDDWSEKVARGRDPGGPPPQVEPIDTFEGGTLKFVLTRATGPGEREVLTMYPEPPKEGSQ